MTQAPAPRSHRLVRLSLAVAVGLVSHTVHAATITQQVAVSEDVTRSGFTNGSSQQFFSVVPTFGLFDPTLGTLNSATLSWNVTGHVTMLGDFEATAKLSYAGQNATRVADTNNNPPNNVDFSFIGSVSPLLASVQGVGSTNFGAFIGSIEGHSGLFPWGASLSALGQVSLVYDYTPSTTTPVPEPGILALLGLAAAAAPVRRRLSR